MSWGEALIYQLEEFFTYADVCILCEGGVEPNYVLVSIAFLRWVATSLVGISKLMGIPTGFKGCLEGGSSIVECLLIA